MTTALETTAPVIHDHYDDCYSAVEHSSLESFLANFELYCEGPLACYNVPVWVSFESAEENETEQDHIHVGIFMPRHGNCAIWITPGTQDDAMMIRQRILSIWATRADTGFSR